MPVFIETRTDPFVGERANEAARLRENRNPGGVRRPVRGIEIKQDTYAVIRVLKADGTYINVIDAAGDILEGESSVAKTSHYTNFFIQSVAEERHEKQQIVDTFGDAFIFFFGEAPRIVQVQGVLLNTNDFNWRNEFWANYERYFRGTRLVEQQARLFLIYDDIIIEGYMLNAQAQDSANRPNLIQFSFSLFVTGYSTISALGNPSYPSPDNSMDYTAETSYSEAFRRSQANRNIQTENQTDIASRNLRRSGGAILGTIGGLASGIRNNLLNVDPSISGAVSSLTGAYNNTSNLINHLRARNREGGGAGGQQPALRQLPLRSTFSANTDEFIGGTSEMTARQLAGPLDMAERWRAMDDAADRSLLDILRNPTSSEVFDVLGRAGRAVDEIRNRGSITGYLTDNASGLVGRAVRNVPYGMIAELARED